MNSLLQRQIRRFLPQDYAENSQLLAFLNVVEKTYDELEESKNFLSHTLEIVSSELTEANVILRRDAENHLLNLSHYFEETLAQQPNLIFRCKKEGNHFLVSLARGRLLANLGFKASDLEANDIIRIFDSSKHLDFFHRTWSGENQHFEVRFCDQKLVCSVWLHPLIKDDEVLEIIGIISDITREKAVEDKLRQSSEALEQRAQELEKSRKIMLSVIEDLDQSRAKITQERDRSNLLAREAAAANRAKSDFLATMSHEIRTPMNGVLGFTQLLQQSNLSPDQEDFVGSIRSSAESLLRVINDVLDFSKIESGHMQIEAIPFCLLTCVDDVISTISYSAAEKNLDFGAKIAPEVPSSVVGDSLRLRQVLVNLLGNAVKFTHAGEVKLEIQAGERDANSVLLNFRVTDSGIGIPANHIDHLFKVFHQIDSSTSRRFGGSGLGLVICKRLVELMGGSISVKSFENVGSVFSFQIRFPVTSEPAPLIAPIPHPTLTGMRAWIVDTHTFSREIIAELLQSWGMDVISVAKPQETSFLSEEKKPKILFFDSDFEKLENAHFITSLAAEGTQIFLLHKQGQRPMIHESLRKIPINFLLKPIKVSALFHNLISQSHGFSPNEVPASSLRKSPIKPIEGSLKILLAEDHAINRKLALAALAQMGCTATIAENGSQAVSAVMENQYDLILMDVQMPGMDGLEATRRIRLWEKEKNLPRVRIIALTANALAGDREICLQAGMDDYLSKPIQLDKLRKLLIQVDPPKAEGSHLPEKSSDTLVSLRQLASDLSSEDAISLASDFLSDLDGQLELIRGAVEDRDASEASRHAHSLKGAASIFGLTELQKTAYLIENLGKQNSLDEIASHLPNLQKVAQEASITLRSAVTVVTASNILEPMS